MRYNFIKHDTKYKNKGNQVLRKQKASESQTKPKKSSIGQKPIIKMLGI